MSDQLRAGIKRRALELGFTDVGIVGAGPTDHREFYERWLERGHHGEMGYLAREDSRARRYGLTGTMERVRSVIVVTHAYPAAVDPDEDSSRAIVARYARGQDYHDVVVPRLRELHSWIETEVGHPVEARPYADTGPILERDLARRAGLGWFGKNTMAIHPKRGSYWFIGSLLTELELEPDPPFEADHCGSCTACLDACPTGALLGRDDSGAPVMDARRCISYLTIELRGPIPRELRPAIGNRVFGCDICQEVCPWNERFAGHVEAEEAYARGGVGASFNGAELVALANELLATTPDEFKRRFRRSPLYRAHRDGLLRNVCVALGNWGDPAAVAPLVEALGDPQPLVRGHAAWGLGQVGDGKGLQAVAERLEYEDDAFVRDEINRLGNRAKA
jgi:epoxyqueuosine reductase